jgi:hypothetical protein
MSRARILWTAGWALLAIAGGILGADLRNHPGAVQVSFRMAADAGGQGQVFFFDHGGYREEDSSKFALAKGRRLQAYEMSLRPDDPLRAIRLDPGTGEGMVALDSVSFSWRGRQVAMAGESLREAVRPLHDLVPVPGGGGPTFRSTGADPYMEIAVPDAFRRAMARRAHAGQALLAASLVALAFLLWWGRRDFLALLRHAMATRNVWALFASSALLALGLLSLAGAGCDGLCSPRGTGYGMLLLVASLGMAAVGQLALRALGVETASRRPRLFLSLLVGQALLFLYIAVRSAIHAGAPFLPVTATEPVLVAAAALVALAWQSRGAPGAPGLPAQPIDRRWLLVELAMLAAVCIAIGDRELPRLVMLSSDPDTHAYFARRLELDGGVPWSGGNAFHYPMGTAILGFLWAKLAFLDVRNAVTALPLLQAFMAALVLAEGFALRMRGARMAMLMSLAALGLTAAAFLVPMYSNYAHMEGAGRQMGIASFAIVPALLFSRRTGNGAAIAALMLLSLFALVVLNPMNAVVPLVLLAVYGLHQAVVRRRLGGWLLVAPALAVLVLLDPYYFALITGTGMPPSRFTLDPALVAKPVSTVLAQWRAAMARGPADFLSGNSGFLPAQSPLFACIAAALLALLWWLRRWPLARAMRGLALCLFAVLALWAVDALFDVLLDDRRLYLTAPYYWLALAQLKILAVTALLLAAIFAGRMRRHRAGTLAVFAALAIASAGWAMHRTQRMMERPRVDYCGSLGCIEPEDLATLHGFETLARSGRLRPGRVLLPNSLHQARHEKWIFPVTAARAVPFLDLPPVAFFYYQGNPDFTTANYVAHVCERFDRRWLREHGIAYVFLPSRREAACVAGMEALPRTERVLVRHGDSMVLQLR